MCEEEPYNQQQVQSYITSEDPRYPTLVLQGPNWSHGYSVDVETGVLTRICICHAYNSNECCCGAWDISDYENEQDE